MVQEWENKLGTSNIHFPWPIINISNADLFAASKEIYLGHKCEVFDFPSPWQFWMIMLKSGNMDTLAAKCPKDGKKSEPFNQTGSSFPCFGKGCMNMPSMYHNYTKLYQDENDRILKMKGRFYGSWDLEIEEAKVDKAIDMNDTSYYSVTWEKPLGTGSWVFHHVLKTSSKYPWLMLYLRSDATSGFSGGYHYPTRGMSKIVSCSYLFF